MTEATRVQFALRQAVRRGNERAIRLLVGKGADIDWRDDQTGRPLLHSAVEHGMSVSIRELVRFGADKNAVDFGGATALHLAVDVAVHAARQTGREPDWTVTELLLELGVDPTIRDKQGRTAGDLAAGAGIESPVFTLG